MTENAYKPSDHFIGVKPLPIPEHPYTREDIEDYVWRFFNTEHEDIKHTAAQEILLKNAERRFTDFIENLPNYVQVLVIENHVRVQVDTRTNIRAKQGYWGYSLPNLNDIRVLLSAVRLKDDYYEHYLAHELSHDLDNILAFGQSLPNEHKDHHYMSIGSAKWMRALEADLTQPNGHAKHNLNHQLRRVLRRYKPESFTQEGFAFIHSYYLHGYARLMSEARKNSEFEVNEELKRLNAVMHQFFPRSWACFNSEMKPAMEMLAGELYEARQTAKWQSLRNREEQLYSSMQKAALQRGWNAQDMHEEACRLATGYNTDWQMFFEALANPLPKKPMDCARAMFPLCFNARYGATLYGTGAAKRELSLGDLPINLRRKMDHFVQDIDNVVAQKGVAGLVAKYAAFEEELKAAATKKIKASQATR